MPDDVEYTPTYQQYPEVDEYFRHCFHERKRRLGDKRANLLPLVGTIFPECVVSWTAAARAFASGIRTARRKPKPGASSWSTPMHPPK